MKQQKMLNTNKGITLIALVITIVVMLILVAVTISMAVNGGLFDYAGKAVEDTNNAMLAEGQLGSGKIKVGDTWYNSIDEYLKKDEDTTETTLVSLYKAGELKIGDYVDYNPNGATTINPDNPENAEDVEVGALTGYETENAQSVAYESLKWRVLGYDETKNELLLISATPTTGALSFYGYVGYNNYENVLKTTCSKLYSNTSIGASARSITMEDIDTYLGGSAVDKTKYVGGSDTSGGYKYNNSSVSSRYFNIDDAGNLVKLGENDEPVTLDLTSTAYFYMVSDITDTMNQDLLQGSNSVSPYYYLVASRSTFVSSLGAHWCMAYVAANSILANSSFCNTGRDEDELTLCLRPVVSLSSTVTTKDVPVLETAPTINWNDPLGIYK